MVNHGKYSKRYNAEWEKDPQFMHWLTKTSKKGLDEGLPEAWCKLCKCALRAQKHDLKTHKNTDKHRQNESALPAIRSNRQGTLLMHGFKSKTEKSKILDLKLSTFAACHTSIKTIDHLGEMLTSTAEKDSLLADLKLHRTKASLLINRVVAPCMLKELVADVGDSWYCLIVDEGTDTTAVKTLGVMIKYFSFKKMKMVVDYLGLIETPRATADVLYEKVVEFLLKIGLKLCRLFALGTDGANNLCGATHSLYALLKRNHCPNLHLIKCICHGLDKSASKASLALPERLEYMVRETRNWFAHSALRKLEYHEQYQALTGGVKPPQLVKLAATRWLSWYGAVKTHLDQYDALKSLFHSVATAPRREDRERMMAQQLYDLHNDQSNLLFLTFLRPLLKDAAQINVVFQSSSADISVVYKDLRDFIFSIAARVVKPEAIKQSRPGMIRLSEIQALKVALQNSDNFKPLDLVDYGSNFLSLALRLKVPEEKLKEVQKCCADFLVKYLHDLCQRLPSCIQQVEKMRAFTPSVALSERGRPSFAQLPMDLVQDPSIDLEDVEQQWIKLGTLCLGDVCPGVTDFDDVDIVDFWVNVFNMKNGAGKRVFEALGRFVLTALSLPLSNAVVERLFSLLGLVKTKIRNKLGLQMLDSILRIRGHLFAHGLCCKTFEPSKEMLENFNSKTMYRQRSTASGPRPSTSTANAEEMNLEEMLVDDPAPAAQPDDDIEIGLRLEDGDVDSIQSIRIVPEWDEMCSLLEQVDAVIDGGDLTDL